MRGELLNQEVFYALQEAKVLIERWRSEYNHADRIDHWAIAPSTASLAACPVLQPGLTKDLAHTIGAGRHAWAGGHQASDSWVWA